MVDTVRTLSQLQALFADNVTGDISPQDLRDFLVSTLIGKVTFVEAADAADALTPIQTALDAASTAGGGRVVLEPTTSTYNITANSGISVPQDVIFDLNGQTIQWTNNVATATNYAAQLKPGGFITNGTISMPGTGTGCGIFLDGDDIFDRDLNHAIVGVTIIGTTGRSHNGIYALATGATGVQSYVNFVKIIGNNISLVDECIRFEASGGDGTAACFVNGNDIASNTLGRFLVGFAGVGTDANNSVDSNTFSGNKFQCVADTTRLATFDHSSANRWINTDMFDWSDTGETIGVEFNAGSIQNKIAVRASGTDADGFVTGANKSQNRVDIENESFFPQIGSILVSHANGVRQFQCVADGSTDCTATITSATDLAVANLPAVVEFGPGDFGLDTSGMNVQMAQGSRGLSIKGQGAAVTRFRFTGGDEIGNPKTVFDVQPSTTTTPGSYSDYLQDVTISGIGFYDDAPGTHEGTEETHGVIGRFIKNFIVTDCRFESLGDEAISYSDIIGGQITNNSVFDCPSMALGATGSGGSGISIGKGCRSIVVADNVIQTSDTPGTKSTQTDAQGINIAVVVTTPDATTDIKDIVIANNTINDAVYGILINVADTNTSDIYNVTLEGNIIRNCTSGIRATGSNGVVYNTSVVGNTIDTCSSIGIDFTLAAARNIDFNMSFNNVISCADTGIKPNGTGGTLSGNVMRECPRGIYVFDGNSVNIVGGTFDRCGGNQLEEIEFASGDDFHVSGVQIFKSRASRSSIIGANTISDTHIQSLDYGYQINFDAGTAEFFAGETLTGGTSAATATIDVVKLESGSWAGNDAAGYILLDSDIAGTFQDNETITSLSGSATAASASSANINSEWESWLGYRMRASDLISGCTSIGGVRVQAAGCVVQGNRFVYPAEATTATSNSWAIRADVNDMQILNNHVDTTANGVAALRAIGINSGITGTLVMGNVTDWASTAGGSYIDSGTGTKPSTAVDVGSSSVPSDLTFDLLREVNTFN